MQRHCLVSSVHFWVSLLLRAGRPFFLYYVYGFVSLQTFPQRGFELFSSGGQKPSARTIQVWHRTICGILLEEMVPSISLGPDRQYTLCVKYSLMWSDRHK